MGYPIKDLTGQRFGKLTVLYREGSSRDHRPIWICRCDCGNTKAIPSNYLLRGSAVSCGCTRQKGIKDPLYSRYMNMLARCYNKNMNGYKTTGAKGIKVCEEWREDFYAFKSWALEHGWIPGRYFVRKDLTKDFSPENCAIVNDQRYVTIKHAS